MKLKKKFFFRDCFLLLVCSALLLLQNLQHATAALQTTPKAPNSVPPPPPPKPASSAGRSSGTQIRARTAVDNEKYKPDENEFAVIDESEQDKLLDEAAHACLESLTEDLKNIHDNTSCPVTWDTVLCWPRSGPNISVRQDCPKYINKFNIRNDAVKHCQQEENSTVFKWSKTDFSQCLLNVTIDFEVVTYFGHMVIINVIRIVGYISSMVILFVSIIVLLRPKLRCPRNFVHVNLFLAFVARTIMVMLVDVVLKNKSSALFDNHIDEPYNKILESANQNYIYCKILMVMFRYSGSVYHVAIFSEAIYLVLLLKFPYYSEKKGMHFCIIASWTMPFIWMTPWVLVKVFIHDYWCWHTESHWNYIIKVPHSLLLTSNIICAIFIIRILYSKMVHRNMSRDKLIKYRRLAKSILILIPIFGLHFIIFMWVPYANSIDLDPTFEIAIAYIETFCNAFQGLVVAVACCYIHREVRIETLLMFVSGLSKLRCLTNMRCMGCLQSDYIRQLRYSQHRGSNFITLEKQASVRSQQAAAMLARATTPPTRPCMPTLDEEESAEGMLKSQQSVTSSRIVRAKKNSLNMSIVSAPPISLNENDEQACCGCLFDKQKNDFYASPPSRPRPLSESIVGLRLFTRGSSRLSSLFHQNRTENAAIGSEYADTAKQSISSNSNSNSKRARLHVQYSEEKERHEDTTGTVTNSSSDDERSRLPALMRRDSTDDNAADSQQASQHLLAKSNTLATSQTQNDPQKSEPARAT